LKVDLIIFKRSLQDISEGGEKVKANLISHVCCFLFYFWLFSCTLLFCLLWMNKIQKKKVKNPNQEKLLNQNKQNKYISQSSKVFFFFWSLFHSIIEHSNRKHQGIEREISQALKTKSFNIFFLASSLSFLSCSMWNFF